MKIRNRTERGVSDLFMLDRFVAKNPGCRVGRPKLALAASVCGGALLAVMTGVVVGVRGMSGEPAALVVGAALVAVGIAASRGWVSRLSNALELMRRGHACYAIGKREILLVDTVGNTVVIALDQIEGLTVNEGDVHIRVSSELQGVIYAILFDLFDEEGPGPSMHDFFDVLAPVLRHQGAEIVTDDPVDPALYV